MLWIGSNKGKSLLTICEYFLVKRKSIEVVLRYCRFRRKPEYVNHWDKVGQKAKSIAEPAYEPVQAVGFVQLSDSDQVEMEYIAQHYRIEGDAPENLCRWNREVRRAVLFVLPGSGVVC